MSFSGILAFKEFGGPARLTDAQLADLRFDDILFEVRAPLVPLHCRSGCARCAAACPSVQHSERQGLVLMSTYALR